MTIAPRLYFLTQALLSLDDMQDPVAKSLEIRVASRVEWLQKLAIVIEHEKAYTGKRLVLKSKFTIGDDSTRFNLLNQAFGVLAHARESEELKDIDDIFSIVARL